MGRILSAKDKAFQEERMRLMKEAENFRQLVIARDKQLYEKERKIIELEKTIEILHTQIQEHLKMTPEEFTEHLNKDMRGVEAIEFLKAMTGRIGGFY